MQEHKSDSFKDFKRKLTHVAAAYPNASGLVSSMPRRVAMCIEKNGDMIKT